MTVKNYKDGIKREYHVIEILNGNAMLKNTVDESFSVIEGINIFEDNFVQWNGEEEIFFTLNLAHKAYFKLWLNHYNLNEKEIKT